MAHWPTSRSTQAGIAFLISTVLAVIAYKLTESHQFANYVQAYPHDGQDGLEAFVDGLYAAAATELVGFILIFILQIAFVSPSKSEE
jgi:hypothetical protein